VGPSESDASLDTEDRILHAAQRVFVRRGVSGTRMQEIADEADVNRALLNYYFRTKKRLAEAVFVRVARSFFPQMLQILSSDLPLRDKLQKTIDTELRLLSQNPYLPGYLIAEFQYRSDELRQLISQAVPVDRVRSTLLGTLQEQLDDAADRGELRPTGAEDLVVSLVSQVIFPFAAAPMLQALLGLDRSARDAMMERRRDDLADTILRGLSA